MVRGGRGHLGVMRTLGGGGGGGGGSSGTKTRRQRPKSAPVRTSRWLFLPQGLLRPFVAQSGAAMPVSCTSV